MSILLAGALLPGAAMAAPVTSDKTPAAAAVTSVDRSVAPMPTTPAPSVTMPVMHHRVLKNGIPVWFAERKDVPLTHVVMVFTKAGAKYDPVGKYGLAEFATCCLDEGAGEYDSLGFARQRDLLGATMEASAGWDYATVGTTVVKNRLDKALALMADMTMRPTFPQKELDRIRSLALGNFLVARTQPGSIAAAAFNRYIFGEYSRYGSMRDGTAKDVAGLTRDDVLKYYENCINPQTACLVVCGDFDVDETTEMLNRHFGQWKSTSADNRDIDILIPSVKENKAPRIIPENAKDEISPRAALANNIIVVDRPGSPQSVIRVGCQAINVKDPAIFPVRVLNAMLGGTFTSRLNNNLRERNGYTYGASSGFDMRLDRGAFAVSTNVQADKTIPAVREIFNELNGIHQQAPDSEVQNAINYLAYTFPNLFEGGADLAGGMARCTAYQLPDDYYSTYVANLQSVTPKQIREAADRLLNTQFMKVIIVGDAQAIAPQLAKVGWRAQVVSVDDVMGPEVEVK